MGSEVTHTHMDTHTQSTCLMDFLWNCLKMLAQSRAGSFVSYMLPFCPHRVWYITEKHNFKLNCNFKVDTPPPTPPKKTCYLQLSSLSLAVCIPTAFFDSFDFLCGWASALIFEPVHRDSTVRQPPGCMCYSMHWCNYTYVSPQPSLALSHTNTYSHAGI